MDGTQKWGNWRGFNKEILTKLWAGLREINKVWYRTYWAGKSWDPLSYLGLSGYQILERESCCCRKRLQKMTRGLGKRIPVTVNPQLKRQNLGGGGCNALRPGLQRETSLSCMCSLRSSKPRELPSVHHPGNLPTLSRLVTSKLLEHTS